MHIASSNRLKSFGFLEGVEKTFYFVSLTFMIDYSTSINTVFIVICAFLVFFMQVGFAMLEVGSVRAKFKTHMINLVMIDLVLGVIAWWLFGYGFAYGTDVSGFIGNKYFAGSDVEADNRYLEWMFEWVFALGATILSGSVAERVSLLGYGINSFFISSFIYPVVVHWGWSPNGWLITRDYKDFAGSGVVHLTGGTIALIGAIVVGARKFRWLKEYEDRFKPNNKPLAAFGTIVLWFGWYGFNCGSTLSTLDENAKILVRVAMNTTLASASGGVTALFIYWYRNRKQEEQFDVIFVCNGILAGVVGVTSACDNIESWAAVLIGIIAAFLYTFYSWLLKNRRIDDTIDASPVHAGCGSWGVIAVGVFDKDSGFIYGKGGHQLGIQLVGLVAIMVWAGGLSFISISILKKIGVFRMNEELEIKGTDNDEYRSIRVPTEEILRKNSYNENNGSGGNGNGGQEYEMVLVDIPSGSPPKNNDNEKPQKLIPTTSTVMI